MSNNINQDLLERAYEVMEQETGTMWERMIKRDIESGDLESLRYHVVEAERHLAIEEDNLLIGANDVY